MNDLYKIIEDFTVDGKCSNCGECCSDFLPMSQAEVVRIKSYMKSNNIKEQRHNFMSGVDLTCPFRDEANKKCIIYSVRPAICRQFMCNHSQEDIMKAKFDFHAINRVVIMRHEFFDSNEDVNFIGKILWGE